MGCCCFLPQPNSTSPALHQGVIGCPFHLLKQTNTYAFVFINVTKDKATYGMKLNLFSQLCITIFIAVVKLVLLIPDIKFYQFLINFHI